MHTDATSFPWLRILLFSVMGNTQSILCPSLVLMYYRIITLVITVHVSKTAVHLEIDDRHLLLCFMEQMGSASSVAQQIF